MWPFSKRKKTRIVGFTEHLKDDYTEKKKDYTSQYENDTVELLEVPFMGRTITIDGMFAGCSTFKEDRKDEN